MPPSNRNQYIEAAKAHGVLKSLPSSVARLAELAQCQIDESGVGKHKTKKDAIEHNKTVENLEHKLHQDVNGIIGSWTKISGNGNKYYAYSRDISQAKRKVTITENPTEGLKRTYFSSHMNSN